ncbi:hypothetical protein RCO28_08155 [Streptomyces sp. LHD-70]|uniref:hypothetical protein n=1 Tax=Streptomyces sp. LHD-70 TaxID=3072140 RepID=UPI00280E219B|nr:hypothetical protein [Streptomyces sp. LHD-70]MDQ8702467.1 hypothetical protein [Streptomyces sp. LHD-70]
MALEVLRSADDPRGFRCVEQRRAIFDDDIMVLATAEQREGLSRALGLTFQAPLGGC